MGDDIGGTVALIVVAALVGLIGYGGYALYRDKFGTPDDKCFWMVEEVGDAFQSCLLDAPPDGECVSDKWGRAHIVECGKLADLASIAQKSGRRICGQRFPPCRK